MMTTPTPIDTIERITRQNACELATVENQRMAELLHSLADDDWAKPTDCPAWDVRAMAGHVLGMTECFASVGQFVRQMSRASKAAGDGPMVDGLTALQVSGRAHLDRSELLARYAEIGPKGARTRARVPALLRRMPMKEEVGGVPETWRFGYLLDVILTRDTWMHRVDISRATGRDMVLTADHDGRIVGDVVAEWARRHGDSFVLHLEGPAGGTFSPGAAGASLTLDAVEFCRILAGRADGSGLLSQEVPF